VHCTNCGNTIDPGWHFCRACGAPALPGAAAPPPASPGAVPAAEVAAEPGGWAADGRPLPYSPEGVSVLGAWTEGLVWLATALTVALVALGALQRAAWKALATAPRCCNEDELDELSRAETAYTTGFGLFWLLVVAGFVVLVVWTYRAYRQAAAPDADLRFGRGWAIGAWFVPLANLVLVPMLLFDLWRLVSDRPERPRGRGWRRGRGNPLVLLWLATWSVGTVLSGEGDADLDDATVADVDRHFDLLLAAPVNLVVAGVALGLFVRRTRRRLDARDLPGPSGPIR
jgi:predicted nucleic acid-binding Zn ribbon protein